MIILRWAPFPEADVASYKVYRSIIGFRFTKPALSTINGKTLELKFNGGSLFTITFNGTDPIVDQINSVVDGGQAYESNDGNSVFVRSDIREAPGSVEIVGGTVLGDIGQTTRLITEKSEDELIDTVAALSDPEKIVEYEDPDGALQDWYAVSTLDGAGNESRKTNYMQPIQNTGPLCILEGIVYNLQGVRAVDKKVIAEVQTPPDHASNPEAGNITKEPVETLTGPDGRFRLAVLQCALIELRIPDVGFSHFITVPQKSFAFVNSILEDLGYQYPLGYRGPR